MNLIRVMQRFASCDFIPYVYMYIYIKFIFPFSYFFKTFLLFFPTFNVKFNVNRKIHEKKNVRIRKKNRQILYRKTKCSYFACWFFFSSLYAQLLEMPCLKSNHYYTIAKTPIDGTRVLFFNIKIHNYTTL